MLSAPFSPCINSKIQRTDSDAGDGERGRGNVGVNQRVEVMKQKSALVRLNAGPAFKPVFEACQRAAAGKNFDKDAPEQRSNMQPLERRARSRKDGAGGYPKHKEGVHQQYASGQRKVDLVFKDDDGKHCGLS